MDRMRDAGRVIKSYRARRTMIICDKNMLRLGYTHEVINSLIAKNIEYVLFSDAGKQPEEALIESCIVEANRHKIDSVIAIGSEEVMAFYKDFRCKSHVKYPFYEIEIIPCI